MARTADRAHPAQWYVALVAAALVALSSLSLSAASYSGTAGTAGSFGTAACYYRATVQRGTAVSTADGITAATITAVDPARSFLMFTSRHNSNRPVGSEIGGRIASATSIEFYRDTDEATPVAMTIEWSVVTYACGVVVQRGSVVQTSATVDVALTPVASTAQAFVLWSKNVHAPDQLWDANDPVVGDLTSTTNLQFRADAANVNHTIWWEVVEFTDPAMIRVQRGTTSFTGGAVTNDVVLPTTFSGSRTFLLVGWRGPTGTDMASSMLRGRLSGSQTVALDRSGGTYDVTEVGYQVVELFDGTSVQSGSTGFCTTCTVGNAFLSTPVDLARTNAFASGQTGGGQNGGRTTYTADDVVGAAAFALALTSTTNLELQRDVSAASGASANVGFFVVSWGLP